MRITPHIRWLIRRDYGEVQAIENASFDQPWTEDDFTRAMRQRNCIGMVAEHDEIIVGYMIYELHKTRLHVLNFAVHPDWRRRGIGEAMLTTLIGKLCGERRHTIRLEVRETNLDAQVFFRDMGLRATGILRQWYGEEDAFTMEYRTRKAVTCE